MRLWPLTAVFLLSACSYLSPYKIEIQQGNYVSQEMVSKLKPGMTRSQVRFVLGTPLLTDMFHASRWDYVYFLERGGKVLEERKLILFFDGDKLVRIEGDVAPAEPSAEAPSRGASAPGAQPQGAAR